MSEEQKIVLATSYFGPVQYFTKFLLPGEVYLEKHENFTKQTFRNRCVIYGANGLLSLTIPVKRGSFHKVKISELEIEYKCNWQDNHWRSIESAYRSTPYFQFYEDEIRPIFQLKTRFLLDLNSNILNVMLGLLQIDREFIFTRSYCKSGFSQDYREALNPKKMGSDPIFHPAEYPQVFQPKFGFQSNLSILDLLFNTGPDATVILNSSLVNTG